MFKLTFVTFVVLFYNAYALPYQLERFYEGRIIGGNEVRIEDYPFQISLQYYGGHRCGGSVIAPNVILTAAHCVHGISASTLKVRAGSALKSSGGSLVQVAKFYAHERYNPSTIDYDIAILILEENLRYSDKIQPIGIATVEAVNEAHATVSGWGNQREGVPSSPENLKAVDIRIISNKRCRDYYGSSAISDQMMCAGIPEGGKGSCQGDSGGPLVSGGKVVGVVSWAYGCSRPNVPTVFGNVANLSNWVNEKKSLA